MRTIARWAATLVALAIALAFLYSMFRFVAWTSPYAQYELGLMRSAAFFCWAPPGRIPAEGPFGWPGWSIAGYDPAWARPIWFGGFEENATWCGVTVPLWIPFLPFFAVAIALWIRDRHIVRQRWREWTLWLTPHRPKRMRLTLIGLFFVLHLVGVFVATSVFMFLCDLFIELVNDTILEAADLTIVTLVLTSPLWGVAWAWLYVRLLNRRFRRQPTPHCLSCGYDLTGTSSGRCPECGRPVEKGRATPARARATTE